MILGLQAGRAIAALLVVLHHATLDATNFYGENLAFDGFWGFGNIGVDFFFVLSGFIIAWIHSEDPKGIANYRQYSLKRITRIYPPFIPISLGMLVLYSAFPNVSELDRNISILSSLFLVPTEGKAALSVAWTLMHEMLFYIVFSLIYIVGRKILFGLLAFWAISICVSGFYGGEKHYLINFVLNPHNLQFLMGVFVATLYARSKPNDLHLYVGMLMIVLYVIFYQYKTFALSKLLIASYLGLGFSLIVYGLCAMEPKIRYPKALLFLGAASYSIYLVHNPIISVLNRVVPKFPIFQSFYAEGIWVIISLGSILAGCAYYLIWEKPLIKKLGKLSF